MAGLKRHLWRDRKHDPLSEAVAEPRRCFAPEDFRHLIPSRVVFCAKSGSRWNHPETRRLKSAVVPVATNLVPTGTGPFEVHP